jgi:prevent-host-death family protein
MEQVKVAEAKAQLSALLERVERGEEILIARRGKAIARLVPEPRRSVSAAQALAAAWAMGGLDMAPVAELAPDAAVIALD